VRRQQVSAVRDTSRAVVLLARTTILFRVRGRRAVARATRCAIRVTDEDHRDACERSDEIQGAFWAVERATHLWPLRVTCLQVALTLHHLLRERGLSAPVRLGVRAKDGGFAAHAWVRCGPFLLDSAKVAADFEPFFTPRRAKEQRATT
jgi:hypothetical protein